MTTTEPMDSVGSFLTVRAAEANPACSRIAIPPDAAARAVNARVSHAPDGPTIADRLTPEQAALLKTWLDQGDA